MREVTLKIDGHVAVLTLNAPERHNALTPEMSGEMVKAIEAAESDEDVGALVVQGAGGSFCAGAHLKTLEETGVDPSSDESFRSVGAVYDSFVRLGQAAVPTIAAVTGPAVGAGLNLALATDLRVVATDARIFSGFDRLGVHPGGGNFVLLARLCGREAAAALSVFGEEINGERAVALGMAWEAVQSADVQERARQLAASVAADPELARYLIANFRTETGPPMLSWEAAVGVERSTQMWSFARKA